MKNDEVGQLCSVKKKSDLDTSAYGSNFSHANDPIPSSADPDVWREYVDSANDPIPSLADRDAWREYVASPCFQADG